MLKMQRNTRLYRVTTLEQLQDILSSNYGSVFQIYVTSSINIGGVAIPAWTLFNVQLPANKDTFYSYGYQSTTGEEYVIYADNDTLKARKK